jgi:hypothetical protein
MSLLPSRKGNQLDLAQNLPGNPPLGAISRSSAKNGELPLLKRMNSAVD